MSILASHHRPAGKQRHRIFRTHVLQSDRPVLVLPGIRHMKQAAWRQGVDALRPVPLVDRQHSHSQRWRPLARLGECRAGLKTVPIENQRRQQEDQMVLGNPKSWVGGSCSTFTTCLCNSRPSAATL